MIDLRLVESGLDLSKLSRDMAKELEAAVRMSAFDVQAAAQRNAPKDTSALANSIYVVTRDGSTEAGAKTRALILNRDAAAGWQDAPPLESEYSALVVVGVEYGIYVEYGHFVARSRPRKRMSTTKKGSVLHPASRVGTRQPGTYVAGRWFMRRAMLQNREVFAGRVRKALDRAEGLS